MKQSLGCESTYQQQVVRQPEVVRRLLGEQMLEM